MQRNPKTENLLPSEMDLLYPAKVWALNIFLVAPITMVLFSLVTDQGFNIDKVAVISTFIVVGMFLSVPTLVGTYIIFIGANRKGLSNRLVSILCCLAANVGITITFLILGGTEMLKITLIYIVATCFSFLILPQTSNP